MRRWSTSIFSLTQLVLESLLPSALQPSSPCSYQIYGIRWCPPVRLILEIVIFHAQGRLGSMRFGIVEGMLSFEIHRIFSPTKPCHSGCLALTYHEVLQELISTWRTKQAIRTRLVCGTDGHRVDPGCVNSPFSNFFIWN